MAGGRERRRRSERKCETRKAERGGGTLKQAAEPTGIARRLERGEADVIEFVLRCHDVIDHRPSSMPLASSLFLIFTIHFLLFVCCSVRSSLLLIVDCSN